MNDITNLFRLNGCVALVTGASGYLGESASLALSSAGASVILNARTETPLRNLAEKIRLMGNDVLVAPADLLREKSCTALAEQASLWKNRIDIVVHCAYAPSEIPETGFSTGAFEDEQRVVCGAFHQLAQECLPVLKEGAKHRSGGASIIALSSMYGLVSPNPGIYAQPLDVNPPYYGAAKAGLLQLVRWMSCNFANSGIRVNSISPGAFPKSVATPEFEAFQKRLCEKIPLARVGRPNEIAGPVVFLASDASSYMTGANLVVDGGWTAW